MKRPLGVGIAAFALALSASIVAARSFRNAAFPASDTPYQALLLDNGAVYYGKIDRVERDFSVVTDVYYIQGQVDTVTKQTRSVLIRRGNEWHAPDRTVINNRHIVMIEPVTAKSKLAELIAARKTTTP